MEARLSFDDKHEIIYTYAADGRKLRAEYRINNFAVVDRDDEFGEMDDIGLPLSDVATFGLRDTMVVGGIIDLPNVPPFTTLTTRDYCGNYIYRNGTLERILTPTGYIEGDTLHHYIKDYQGNVRCVVRHDGTLVESNEYYPYGGLFSATASTQPYKYGAKELDRTHGLDLYDSEARWYDSLLGRTSTMDTLGEKYYSLSPYLWCAGNPVKNIDLKGDSVAVLYEQSAIGHLALLIQNEKGKWMYYSFNGIPVYEFFEGFSGGKPYHDLGVKTFDSPDDFMNSTYNREGSKEEVRNNEINNYGYDEAYTIPTDSAQDNKIRSAFQSEAKKPYNLLSHQCAQVVQLALNAGGINTKKILDIEFNILGITIKKKFDLHPFFPANTFETIRQNNP